MIYHHPTFIDTFQAKFDWSFNIFSHNLLLYVIAPNAYFTPDMLLGFLTDALIESVERPSLPLSGPLQRSLFESPPVPHCRALAEALSLSWEYVLNERLFDTGRGERRKEYCINLRIIRGILIDVRRSEDTKRAEALTQDEFYMSDRLLLVKGLRHDGRDIGRTRSAEAMRGLVELGICKNNGTLRTLGREVLRWRNS